MKIVGLILGVLISLISLQTTADKDGHKHDNYGSDDDDGYKHHNNWSKEDEKAWKDDDSHREKHKDRWGRHRTISLVQIQHMDFGTLASGGKRCALKANTNLVGDCVGNGVLGEMLVKGRPHYMYNVVVNGHGWVNKKNLIPKLTAQDYYLGRNGKDLIYVRGAIKFKSGFNEVGLLNLSYTITVYYQ